MKLLWAYLFTIAMSSCDESNVPKTNTTGGNENTPVKETLSKCNSKHLLTPSKKPEVETIRQALIRFRKSLTTSLVNKSTSCLEDDRLLKWHNTPPGSGGRDGIFYGDLSTQQLNKFRDVLRLFLSQDGYQKIDEITVLAEGFLNEKRPSFWSTDYYSIDMFGDPETSGSYAIQLDGHHCVVNFLVHGDNVSIVPAFLGGEPVKEVYKGKAFDIFKDERELALQFYNHLSQDQKNQASIATSKSLQVGPPARNGYVDPYTGSYDYSVFAKGLPFSALDSFSQSRLKLLMKEYVYNLHSSFADLWWKDIEEHIEKTYFVWWDNVATPVATTQFYYRIYNPYLWVEFSKQNPVGGGVEDWNHVHSITRIPNNPSTKHHGDYNLFAKLLNGSQAQFLAQHIQNSKHHLNSTLKLDYTMNFNSHRAPKVQWDKFRSKRPL